MGYSNPTALTQRECSEGKGMANNPDVTAVQVTEGNETYTVTLIEAEHPTRVGLFAVGRGGNPLRHLPLLQAVAKQGCTVVAPHFEMLSSTIPTKAELDLRIGRLEASAMRYAQATRPIVGIGHSIGAVTLLALAGGEGETRDGQRLAFGSEWKFSRLALLAPPTDFFRRPGALRTVRVPIRIWAGRKDTITPPDQALFLKEALESQTIIDVVVNENAGHFTYMNEPPPQFPEPHPDRHAFLTALADEVTEFVLA
jgi:pimeloyl-ACP methyl ester carboxylesterase